MRIKLYLDEDIPAPLSHALRQRDIDILTTQEAGMLGASDPEQIEFASEKGRAFLTHNKRDFIILHKAYMEQGKAHSGIIVADQNKIGPLLRMVLKLCHTLSAEEMKDRLEFLGRWEK